MPASDIPDSWPPAEGTFPEQTAPVFPLPKVFLYPHVIMPLHIFEPRYRQMVDDLLDRRGWLIITPIREGHEDNQLGVPPIYPVGGLGEIIKHERKPDGRFMISLAGLGRVNIREVPSDRLYRKVQFEPFHEVQPDESENEELSDKVRGALLTRSDSFTNLPDDLPLAPMADLLIQSLELPVDVLAELFAEPVVKRRAEFALERHESRK